MTASAPSPFESRLRAAAVLHFVAMVAFRLITDADDFSNWDLVSFLNANAFGSLSELLQRSEVHFVNPFSFPIYNTGSESAVATVIHYLMSGVSLYWSNTVVLAFFDVTFVLALSALFRLVFADALLEGVAWLFVAMSAVVLTFSSTLAFDMQAFATLAWALVGCELVLQSRRAAGLLVLAVAFTFISQAYPLTFYLPLFCLVWLLARAMMLAGGADGDARGSRRFAADGALLVAAVAGLVAAIEWMSGSKYLEKVFWVVSEPLAGQGSYAWIPERLALLAREAFVPVDASGRLRPGFAPYFLCVALFFAAGLAIVSRRRLPSQPVPARRGALRTALVALAWSGLVLFGYLPTLLGTHAKSQRCFFGDLFLAMALAAAAGWLMRSGRLTRRTLLASLVVLVVLADAFYISAVAAVDHRRPHWPVFDYDTADGMVRHDLDSAIDIMRRQASDENAGLIVHYPRGGTENSTDPAVFHARFLRRFGSWRGRDDVIFSCHFCSMHYGCPFPDVTWNCGQHCCYRNPLSTVLENPGLVRRKMYLWWFSDPLVPDEPRQSVMLASLRQGYQIRDAGTPAQEKRWRCFELVPTDLEAAYRKTERGRQRSPQ